MSKQTSRYDACPDMCGQLEHPGLALHMSMWVDHTRDDTTVDQQRIEDVLERMDLDGRRILHVGVGNSRFAQRFAGRVRLIDGPTVKRRSPTRFTSPITRYTF
jgi:hypothetical protein